MLSELARDDCAALMGATEKAWVQALQGMASLKLGELLHPTAPPAGSGEAAADAPAPVAVLGAAVEEEQARRLAEVARQVVRTAQALVLQHADALTVSILSCVRVCVCGGGGGSAPRRVTTTRCVTASDSC